LQLPCCASTHSSTASRLSCLSCLSCTCASRARAHLDNVYLSTTLPGTPQYSALVRASQAHALKSASSHNSKPLVSAASQAASRTPTLILSRALLNTPSATCASPARPFASLSLTTLSQVHTQNSTSAFSTRLLRTAPRSLLGAFQPCPPIGRGHATPPPCLSSLRKQADEDDAHLLLRRSARAFRRDISPRFGKPGRY